MNGFDVLLSRAVPAPILKGELTRVLSIQADALELVTVEALSAQELTSKCVCTTAVVGGEFPLLLAIHAPDEFELPTATTLAEHVSRSLDVSVLVDDGTAHPYRMTLIRWNAEPRAVEIEPADDDRINLVDSPSGHL